MVSLLLHKKEFQFFHNVLVIELFISLPRLLAPWNAPIFYGNAVPVEKSHLITEKSGHVIECFRMQPQPVPVINSPDKILHLLSVKGIKLMDLMPLHTPVFILHPPAPAVRKMFQHSAVGRSGRPSVFIVYPELQADLLRV